MAGALGGSRFAVAPGTSSLAVRVGSALVMVPVWVGVIWAGGWVYHLGVALGAGLAMREWTRMVVPGRWLARCLLAQAVLMTALALLIWVGPAAALAAAVVLAPLPLLAPWLVPVLAPVAGESSLTAVDRGWLVAGGPYLALGAGALVWLRDLPGVGLPLVCFLFITVWATDIGAYFAGRAVGGPRLAPEISPAKTWAGLVGGMMAAAVAGGLVALVAGAAAPLVAIGVAAALAVVEQGGDLFESAVKRRYRVKDSGGLIPGHGGVLDRVDGLVAAAPTLALFHVLVGALIPWW